MLLLTGIFFLAFHVDPVSAQENPIIYINSDGSISPATTSISTVDNVTYRLTGDMTASTLIIERNNTIFDGAADNSQWFYGKDASVSAILLINVSGVVINNTRIDFYENNGIDLINSNNITVCSNYFASISLDSIYLSNCFDVTISGNSFSGNQYGVFLDAGSTNVFVSENDFQKQSAPSIYVSASPNNTIIGNTLENNYCEGIELESSPGNTITGNIVSNTLGGFGFGMFIADSSDTTVDENTVTLTATVPPLPANWGGGIYICGCSNDSIFQNIFEGNKEAIVFVVQGDVNNVVFHNSFISDSVAMWSGSVALDDGYPAGGNYWSNYNGTDLFSGPYQNVTGSDGIGDTPYVIDANDIDNYPLMQPYVLPSVTISPGTGAIGLGMPQTFTANPEGGRGPPFTYQWYLDGAPVSNANDSTWTFTPSSITLHTIYVVVADVCGVSATSNIARVSVFALAPNVTVQVSSPASTHPGEMPVTISATNTGNCELSNVQIVDTQGIISVGNITLEPGLSSAYSEEVVIPSSFSSTIWQDTFYVSGTDPLGSNVSDSVVLNVVVLNPAISIAESSSLIGYQGDNITYAVTVNNTGNCPLYAIVVNDTILGEIYSCDYWSVGQSETFNINYTVPFQASTFNESSTIISNATAYAIDALGWTVNDSASWTVLVPSPVIVSNITVDNPWVYKGGTANVNVTIKDNEPSPENVWVTLYYNITANESINAYPILLNGGQSYTLQFEWDTGTVPCLNYTLTTTAALTNSCNTLSNGTITVRLMGDVNGDGRVDLKDLALVARAFGSTPGSPNWNPAADVNGDGVVNMKDIALVARNFGQHYP